MSPRSQSKSFYGVQGNMGTVKQKVPSTYRGEPAAFFSKEEISKLAAPFRYTLVGKFSYKRPKMELIRNFFHSLDLKSLQSVRLLHEKYIVIFITQEEDYTRLLMRAIWYIAGAPMKILKWSPEFYPNVESPIVPVWIGLPGLPLHFFEKSALFYIASAFGTPLKVDEPTVNLSRPTVARVCIEVDVSKPRKNRLWVGDEKLGFWQEVVFENPPMYCDYCKMLGHEVSVCFKKNPSLKTETQKVQHNKDTLSDGNKIVETSQKIKEKEKKKKQGRKRKLCTLWLITKMELNGSSWVKNKNTRPLPLRQWWCRLRLHWKKKSLKVDEERAAAHKEARDCHASVISEKFLPTTVVDKARERSIPVLATVPPLIHQHLSTFGITLTPFPDLAKIIHGKGVKDGSNEPSEPYFLKNNDLTSAIPSIPAAEDAQETYSGQKLHERVNIETGGSVSLEKINLGNEVKGGNGAPVEPSFVKTSGSIAAVPIISPLGEFQEPCPQMNLHEIGKVLGPTSNIPLVPYLTPTSEAAIAEVFPAISNSHLQNFRNQGVLSPSSDQATREGQDLNCIADCSGSYATAPTIESGKAAASRVNEIPPLDFPIESQPPDCAERNIRPSFGSGLSAKLKRKEAGPSGVKNWFWPGNLGFEFFNGPNTSSKFLGCKPAGASTDGLRSQEAGPEFISSSSSAGTVIKVAESFEGLEERGPCSFKARNKIKNKKLLDEQETTSGRVEENSLHIKEVISPRGSQNEQLLSFGVALQKHFHAKSPIFKEQDRPEKKEDLGPCSINMMDGTPITEAQFRPHNFNHFLETGDFFEDQMDLLREDRFLLENEHGEWDSDQGEQWLSGDSDVERVLVGKKKKTRAKKKSGTKVVSGTKWKRGENLRSRMSLG